MPRLRGRTRSIYKARLHLVYKYNLIQIIKVLLINLLRENGAALIKFWLYFPAFSMVFAT